MIIGIVDFITCEIITITRRDSETNLVALFHPDSYRKGIHHIPEPNQKRFGIQCPLLTFRILIIGVAIHLIVNFSIGICSIIFDCHKQRVGLRIHIITPSYNTANPRLCSLF